MLEGDESVVKAEMWNANRDRQHIKNIHGPPGLGPSPFNSTQELLLAVCPGVQVLLQERCSSRPPWCLSCWGLANTLLSDFLLRGHRQWSDLNTGCVAEVFEVLFINLCGNLAQALLQLFSFRISRSTGTTTLWETACYFDFNSPNHQSDKVF